MTMEKELEKDLFQNVPSVTAFFKDDKKTVVSNTELDVLEQDVRLTKETFEAIEHKAIGDRAFKLFFDTCKDEELSKLLISLQFYNLYTLSEWSLPNGLKLSSGDIVALSGDFYGIPKAPICEGKDPEDQKSRFRAAYNSLCAIINDPKQQDAHNNEVQKIRKLFVKEKKTICKHLKEGHGPAHALHSIAGGQNVNYTGITLHTSLPVPFFHSRYLDLASQNFDHFGADARIAYRAGHAVALETAIEAKNAQHEEQKLKLLVKAITQELFACHFLTDLFASGHLRTIRRELFNHVQKTGWTIGKAYIAGLLAKEMHDEDNRHGLLVENKRKDEWTSYGDACYFEVVNLENLKNVTETAKEAILSIFNTYLGKPVVYNFEEYIPCPRKGNPTNPLFDVQDGKVMVRKDLKDPKSKAGYEELKSPVAVLVKLRTQLFRPTKEEPELTPEAIEQIEKNLKDLVDTTELTFKNAHGEEKTCTIL